VTIQPHPAADYLAVLPASGRTAGFLADLGAPDLYYVNMDSSILDTIDKFTAALTDAKAAKGLVIDMRGYPGVDHYEVAQRLATGNFSSPIFRIPNRTGPDQLKIDESTIPLSPLDNPSFHGPVALIVGHHTVSAAENFSTMLVDAKRVHVVGRNSAGTNGNITGVQLPGHFAFTFTGMEVRHADAQKSVFHGVGIAPDKDTALSAQDFAAGKDPELLEAIAWLSMQ
jgi:C-terminal processing protease CtpA/Prc